MSEGIFVFDFRAEGRCDRCPGQRGEEAFEQRAEAQVQFAEPVRGVRGPPSPDREPRLHDVPSQLEAAQTVRFPVLRGIRYE